MSIADEKRLQLVIEMWYLSRGQTPPRVSVEWQESEQGSWFSARIVSPVLPHPEAGA